MIEPFSLEHLIQYSYIAGVDEVGRGPLAGPVVTAAVILDPAKPIAGLADSKKLSEKRREALVEEIKEKALAWSIGRSEVEEIDEVIEPRETRQRLISTLELIINKNEVRHYRKHGIMPV